MKWPPNSPGLSAIEPPWRDLKWQQGRTGPRRSHLKIAKLWKDNWKALAPSKLRRYVERIIGNIQWVIRLKGGNEYREGTVPPRLSPEEQEKLKDEILIFLTEEMKREDAADPFEKLCDALTHPRC